MLPIMKSGNQKRFFIGIDPGANGGLAVINEGSGLFPIAVHPMPETERDIWFLLEVINPKETVAVIEKVHSFPKQGVASTFKFGRNYGFLRGCLIASGIPFTEVTPQAWMRGLSITLRKKGEGSRSEWKNYLKGHAQQRFPNVKGITLKTADALLIAEFCRRINS